MKKGFTLIELLAVIVILAVIAVIAVPIVIDIIDDTKESANQISIENYIKAAELAISQEMLNGTKLTDGWYNIDAFDVNVSNDSPDYGFIEIKDGKIVGYNLTTDNKHYSNSVENKVIENNNDSMKSNYELSIDYLDNEYIKGISLYYEDTLTFNLYIDKNKVKGKNIYIRVTSATKYGEEGSIIEEIKEYKTTSKYLIFNYNNILFEELSNGTLFEVVEDDGTESGKTLELINYDVSTYAKNKIYSTKSEFEKDFLKSLINLGAAFQIQFNYKTDNLAYNVLKEEDKNINSFTEKGLEFYNEISNINIDIENNTNQVFTDIGVTVRAPSLKYDMPLKSTIVFRKSSNYIEEELSKYGYILFDYDSYNKLKENRIESFNINSEEIYDIVNKENIKAEMVVYNKMGYYNYKYYFKNLSDIVFALPYYVDDAGNYQYGTLVKFSPVFSCVDGFHSSTSSETMKNLDYSILNLAAVIR